MRNTVANVLLSLGCLLLGSCSAPKSKGIDAPYQETVDESEVFDDGRGNPIVIEYFAPDEIAPESVAVASPPVAVPVPIPTVVPIIVPEDDDDDDDDGDEECPTPEPVINTGERCVEPDHYLSYPINSSSVLPDETVNLDDQFIEPTNFVFRDIRRLFNPATKIHNGVESKADRPNTHYLSVRVDSLQHVSFEDDANGSFSFSNQFGKLTINIPGDLALGGDRNPLLELLLPSLKSACPEGDCTGNICHNCFPDGDHYLCYELVNMDPNECPIGDVLFDDQFLRNRIVDSLIPTRICNPVKKTFNNQVSNASSEPTNHLVCYEVDQQSTPSRIVKTLNQLGLQDGVVEINDAICVPSSKRKTTEEQ